MGQAPNYWPNSFSNFKTNSACKEHCDSLSGDVERFDNQNEDNFEQVTDFWNEVLNEEQRDRLVANIASALKQAEQFIQERSVQNFEKVHPDFGTKLRVALNLHKVSRVVCVNLCCLCFVLAVDACLVSVEIKLCPTNCPLFFQ